MNMNNEIIIGMYNQLKEYHSELSKQMRQDDDNWEHYMDIYRKNNDNVVAKDNADKCVQYWKERKEQREYVISAMHNLAKLIGGDFLDAFNNESLDEY